MNKATLALLIVLLGTFACACNKKDEDKKQGAGATTSQASAGAGGVGSPAAKPAAPANATGTGVKDCDEYLAKFEKCMKGEPGAEETLAATKEAWVGQSEADLKVACKAALDGLAKQPQCK